MNAPYPALPEAEALRIRLRDGWRRIELARARGFDVTSREAEWRLMQRRYESLMDQIFEGTHGENRTADRVRPLAATTAQAPG